MDYSYNYFFLNVILLHYSYISVTLERQKIKAM